MTEVPEHLQARIDRAAARAEATAGGPTGGIVPPYMTDALEQQPRLGLATTEELIRELIARFKMTQYISGSTETVHRSIDRALVLAEMLGGMGSFDREYRTVDG